MHHHLLVDQLQFRHHAPKARHLDAATRFALAIHAPLQLFLRPSLLQVLPLYLAFLRLEYLQSLGDLKQLVLGTKHHEVSLLGLPVVSQIRQPVDVFEAAFPESGGILGFHLSELHLYADRWHGVLVARAVLRVREDREVDRAWAPADLLPSFRELLNARQWTLHVDVFRGSFSPLPPPLVEGPLKVAFILENLRHLDDFVVHHFVTTGDEVFLPGR